MRRSARGRRRSRRRHGDPATADSRRPAQRATTAGASRSRGGERRDGPGEPRRRCHGRTKGRRRARRRGTAGPSPSGGAVPRPPAAGSTHPGRHQRAAVVERGRGRRSGRARAPAAAAGGRVAPRAVVVRAAEQRSRTGDRPPPTRRRRPRAPRPRVEPEAIAQVRERIVRRLRRLEQRARPLRRSRGRAPAAYRPRRRSAPPRRRSPDRRPAPQRPQLLEVHGERDPQHLEVEPQQRACGHAATSTTSTGPATLPARSAIPAVPAAVGGRDRDRHLGRRDERDRAGSRRLAVQEHLDVRGRMGRVEVDRRPLRERPAGPRDDRDDGEADAVPPDEEPGLGRR